MSETIRTVVITGASSGLGAALAREYAAPGITLGLLGRHRERLEVVQAQCEAAGASAECAVVDVMDAAAMQSWLEAFDARQPVDVLIANAGISGGTGGGGEGEEQARRIFRTNIDGVLNTVHPLIPAMTVRKSGQIAIMSSLSGMRGLPSAPAYSASKAAVKAYGEALRGSLGKVGVKLSVICPGYIKTPMTDVNDFPMPFLMQPEKAAKIIRRGLARNRSRIAFPLRLYWPLWLLSCLSPTLTDPLFAALPEKPAAK